MNRKEAERLARQRDTLVGLGFTHEEADALRRISMTLRRWHELECGNGRGCVQRNERTGRAEWHGVNGDIVHIPDRERGALKRLKRIVGDRNERAIGKVLAEDAQDQFTVSTYIQTDPRGAALYILRPGDVPEGERADAYYTRGVCVY